MWILDKANRALVLVAMVMLVGLLFNSALSREGKSGTAVGGAIVTPAQLGGDERYLIYVGLDKPVYRATETLYLRATFLNAADNTPIDSAAVDINLQIKGPKGNVVFSAFANGDDSVAGTKWSIPEGTPGGRYTALVSSTALGAPQTERVFEIRAYRVPRLNTQVEFMREGYGPGDQVQASIKVDRAEGGIPTGANVTVVARVDGTEVFSKQGYRLPKSGILTTQFTLPESIAVGDGSLTFVIEDGGVVETASKTLPIILQTLSIEFYPEGGELVAGIANRVYVQANRPDGKPADIKGRIYALPVGGLEGAAVAELSTSHEGRGVFAINPTPESSYVLVLDAPSGIDRQFELPKVRTTGTVLQSTQAAYGFDDAISIAIASNADNGPVKLTLYKRDQLIDSRAISGDGSFELNAKEAEGVLMVTAWDRGGKPVAERLIYRQPKFAVNVSLSAVNGPFVPGGEVSLDVLTTDENGRPVEAVVGLTVTDDAVLDIVEQREQAPRLPVMVYLENEVTDLADAHVYLDAQNAEAPMAVDLLLGTQGWRRFILVNYEQLKQSNMHAAKRALAERDTLIVSDDDIRLQEAFMGTILRLRKAAQKREENTRPLAEARLPADAEQEDEPVLNNQGARPQFELKEPKAIVADINYKDSTPMVVVREYAHKVRANRKANDRIDFTETLYWHKGVRTNARDGRATVKFGLSDSVTSFRIMGDAFGRNGALGVGNSIIRSVEPFYIEPKMPLEVSVGDVIELPVAMINASSDNIDVANLRVTGEGLTISQTHSTSLAAGSRIRQIVRIVAEKPGSFVLTLSASADAYADRVTRTLVVKPNGFPAHEAYGGLLGPQTGFNTEVVVSNTVEPGSLVGVAKIYPSPLANMQEALAALLRQPNGCFEQTSSTNYPLVMAQQYFLSHRGIDPDKIAKAKTLLLQGYKKLIGFESKDSGYEWFGANPAHEALTAYGLMEFVDMAKVMSIDDSMVARTRRWLLDRRDGKGGFKRNQRAVDSFGSAPDAATSAYIVWSLLESGEEPTALEPEIDAVKKHAFKTQDSYVIALAANILRLANDNADANKLAKKLADSADSDGAVINADTSITRSGGNALLIETTSLALLAWLRGEAHWGSQIDKSIKWLFEQSQSGRFGSTQSTVLALKAINAYDQTHARPQESGEVQLLIDGKAFGRPVAFDENSTGAIDLPDFSAALTPGKHTLGLKMVNGSKMPFAIEVSYNTRLPVSNDEVQLSVETQLSEDIVAEGEPLEMRVKLRVAEKNAPTPIAIIGIPAGLEVRHDQLKELVDADRISRYEVIGRDVILYWRALQANETRTVPISLIAAIPGSFVGQASRAYLYYTDEHKHWVDGHHVTVTAK